MDTRRRNSRADAMRLVGRVRKAIDRGADAAEEIHKQAAHLPLTPFEGVEGLDETLKEIRRRQLRTIRALYDLVRRVNHEVARLAEDLLAAPKAPVRRRVAKKRMRVVQAA
jgi:hypothetical protein